MDDSQPHSGKLAIHGRLTTKVGLVGGDTVTRAVTIYPLTKRASFLWQLSRAQCFSELAALPSMSLEDCIRNGGNDVWPQLLSGRGCRDAAIV